MYKPGSLCNPRADSIEKQVSESNWLDSVIYWSALGSMREHGSRNQVRVTEELNIPGLHAQLHMHTKTWYTDTLPYLDGITGDMVFTSDIIVPMYTTL